MNLLERRALPLIYPLPTMTNRTLKLLVNAIGLTIVAPAAIAAPNDGLGFRPSIGDFHINYTNAANSITVGSSGLGATLSDSIGKAIAEDPKAYCKQVSLGTNSTSNKIETYKSDKGSSSSDIAGKAGGSYLWGVFAAEGSAGSTDGKSWDNQNNNIISTSSSRTVVGTDCDEFMRTAGEIDMNRVNNETQRLGILVGNETQRYDVDKRFQLGLKQIQAQQVVSVFGGGANSMMGSMAK